MSTATTIDEVLARLEEIIETCAASNDVLGYFPALYNRVTQAVRDAIQAGKFQDGPRMEQLDVTFANRYLTAYDQFRTGRHPTAAWRQALGASKNHTHIILQQLLIGMNAHIDLDLGIAAAEVCPGNEIFSLKDDFNRINKILFSLVPTTTAEIGEVSPEFRELVDKLPFKGQALAKRSLEGLRDLAWKLALDLAQATPLKRELKIVKRDAEVVLAGVPILVNCPIIQKIKSEESDDVRHNIEVLSQGEFVYTVKR